jgi:signal peptidase I
MESGTAIHKIPIKRRIWLSIILCLFGPGLPMIYCGRLWQGIIVEASVILVSTIFLVIFCLIPDFLNLIIILIAWIISLVGFMIYNINLTAKVNRQGFPYLNKTWVLIVLVGFLSWFIARSANIIIQTKLVGAYIAPSSSMENTLFAGEWLIATKGLKPYSIQCGDIIIFKHPGNPRFGYQDKGIIYIKRVIAKAGCTVGIVNKRLYVNGLPFNESPKTKQDYLNILPHYEDRFHWGPGNRDNMPEIVVPECKLFVMGDNRDNSADSRYWGYVDVNDVIGKARFIHFSWDSEKNRIRWERLGMRLDD